MQYDVNYYYNLLKAYTPTAQKINEIRWNFLEEYFPFGCHVYHELKGFHILDYGCGVGWFAAFKPSWVTSMETYDVMPVPQTGMTREKYSIITLWDVLEHIPDFTYLAPILERTHYVVLTIPMKPPKVKWEDWKHFKPGEHLHYYTEDLLQSLFRIYDFHLLAKEMTECPPRTDVVTYIFKRGK